MLRRRTWRASSGDGRKVVLHVGSGPRRAEILHPRFRGAEWQEVRLDIDPKADPDVLGTIVDMVRVESASVDAVFSAHNIEHVHAHEVPRVLAEFHRVLRPGGELLLTTPDLRRAAERILAEKLEDPIYTSPSGPVTPLDMLYGFGEALKLGKEYMAHKTGFTAKTLERKLLMAGFGDVEVRGGGPDQALWATARRRA